MSLLHLSVFVSETLMAFTLDYLLRAILEQTALEDGDSASFWMKGEIYLSAIKMSLAQSSGCIVAHYKTFGFLKLVVLLL